MAKKIFKYKGKTLSELKDLSLKAFMELLPSRKRRSLLRGFTQEQKKLLKKLETSDQVKTHCRDLVILPKLVGKTINVYSGKEYNKLVITEEMIGNRLGDFSLSRSRITHSSPGVGATKSSNAISVR